ncbi:molybdopterin oxidoreductase family protein [Paenibacillus sp. HN-1]|uniref:molybdopterin-containing oxidoreductase family protein n=1 Tax=Paenibacillus TaxID=44249 RepID=UPI001CA915E8|nr:MULTISPECIES: molybdopterin oxidoreductase family protein [Paenibacillus]MBY9077692.1 molybdopterin oxidoreductase family protein [Paenibacillus sp. CGMCC 1.18879]MBY9083729.1 molybdopterin oxidoreductase family protein [Paenibacillus sinensis]
MRELKNGVFPAVCPLDCPDTCGLLVHKKDGKIEKVTGNPEHPVTRGAICNKVRHMAERVHHPERLTTPLRRVGPKGEGRFEAISWDEAIAEIAGTFSRLSEEYGPESILPYSFYGNMGILSVEGMDRRFFNALGASRLEQTICNSAGSAGWKYTMGFGGGTSPEDIVNADLILVWGGNIVSTNMHQVVLAEQARKKGAKVVVIDVHRNRTAQWGDWFLPLYPGTDTALALGIMHILFRDGLTDESFLAAYTTGHEELRQQAEEYTPEAVSAITGITAADIERLARMYGEAAVSYIHIGNGLQHHDNGGMSVRTISCLPALTGQWLKPGGGAYKSNGAYASMNARALERPDLRPNPRARSINMNRIGEALEMTEQPIKALFVYCSNPLVVAPDLERVKRGFEREDLFTVVHDLFLTDTAKYADLVLPATSTFENTDLYSSYWHHYVQLQEPVLEPPGDCKSNFEVFALLGQAMGFDDEAFRVTEENMIREALDYPRNPYLNGVTLQRLKEERFVKLDMSPKAQYLERLTTPSGKIELFSRAMENAGLPPLPTYSPLVEGYDGLRRPSPDEKYPLMFISPPNHNFLNSTFANTMKHQALEKRPTLQIHPEDAAARGIEDGAEVKVYNDRGVIEIWALVTDRMLPGTVFSQGLWWEGQDRPQRSNVLTPDRLSDMGKGATFFSTTVQVRLR